ncbi:putative mitochondrial carrier protein [Medicago truncatula]|uniref:Putative mitochondrial carrier protein n=1 Tax=Medicago truncatula TaxID=3880 RepID=A0A072UZT1_MEDTR|nr:probable mitochondrial adenine nucleotide transporter BTL3 [Medicago truncatula]KEH34931.1 substrate carrier family protein [Medicago truncatula]RHN68617.1 putative mitochondrial carrier protein [Medicago truncatula]
MTTMLESNICNHHSHSLPIFFNPNSNPISGGIFLEPTLPDSFLRFISLPIPSTASSESNLHRRQRRRFPPPVGCFLSVSLPSSNNLPADSKPFVLHKDKKVRARERAAVNNTTKHLWSGAISAMVSRTCVAPLERLKLEYIVRGEKRNIFELIKSIATTQGLRGFWKGNLLNILRTAPFKAVNFSAYDTYRKQLLRFSGNEETTNFERFIAGAAAGVTATIICLPLDTIRTKIVAPGGETLGGVIGAFQYMIQTEGIFSLYKGLVPSLISMAPSSAVFYGVYDMLKSSYLHSPEGKQRIKNMHKHGQELSAFDQLELGPVRTLLHGAIAGACAEAATYPFEVVRRQLQLQVQSTKLSSLATFVKIVEQGGISALYAGLIPSLLQVLPSASISYFVYEFMKIVLKVE